MDSIQVDGVLIHTDETIMTSGSFVVQVADSTAISDSDFICPSMGTVG